MAATAAAAAGFVANLARKDKYAFCITCCCAATALDPNDSDELDFESLFLDDTSFFKLGLWLLGRFGALENSEGDDEESCEAPTPPDTRLPMRRLMLMHFLEVMWLE